MTTLYANRLAKAGDQRFLRKISELRSMIDEYQGDGGRYWAQDPFTTSQIALIQQEIAETEHEAEERYRDLASD